MEGVFVSGGRQQKDKERVEMRRGRDPWVYGVWRDGGSKLLGGVGGRRE